MSALLAIKNLSVAAGRKTILRDVSLSIEPASLHVLMGPNGSGKSTLAAALMAHPHYAVSATTLSFNGKNLKTMTTDERARAGMFFGMQYPIAVAGLSLAQIVPIALEARTGARAPKKRGSGQVAAPSLAGRLFLERTRIAETFKTIVQEYLTQLKIPEELLYRSINEAFSGGEKKKSEILQMLMLKPKLALLDEPDSGLDIDSMRILANAIKIAQNAGTAILLITHYGRIFKYLTPDRVHVMVGGRLIESGGPALIKKIEAAGYEKVSI